MEGEGTIYENAYDRIRNTNAMQLEQQAASPQAPAPLNQRRVLLGLKVKEGRRLHQPTGRCQGDCKNICSSPALTYEYSDPTQA